MIERLFKSRRLARQMAAEHLRIIQREFAPHLRSRGHAPRTVRTYCRVAAVVLQWWTRTGNERGPLRPEDGARFLAQRRKGRFRAPPSRRRVCRAALRRLLAFLRQRHGWAAPEPKEAQPRAIEALLVEYERHLNTACGLADASRTRLLREARRFMAWRFGRRPWRWWQLHPADTRRFVTQRARGLRPASIRSLSAQLRNFLRFLEGSHRVPPGMAASVPTYAPWPAHPLPLALDPPQLRHFLGSWTRATPQGRRDYAMALCLAELGLRAGEVAGLCLEDLDWRAMTLRLRQTKQRRQRLLPLPPSVAKVLVAYLQGGRPATPCRAVFVHHDVPKGRALHAYDVGWVMRQALARCGIAAGSAHLLRHTLATRWHRQGVNLKAIADWLGHRDLDTTAGYAQVHEPSLSQVALPWPQADR